MKKVFFIKAAAGAQPWVEVLKNHFKTLDALRDVLDWHGRPEPFSVHLEERPVAPDAVGPATSGDPPSPLGREEPAPSLSRGWGGGCDPEAPGWAGDAAEGGGAAAPARSFHTAFSCHPVFDESRDARLLALLRTLLSWLEQPGAFDIVLERPRGGGKVLSAEG